MIFNEKESHIYGHKSRPYIPASLPRVQGYMVLKFWMPNIIALLSSFLKFHIDPASRTKKQQLPSKQKVRATCVHTHTREKNITQCKITRNIQGKSNTPPMKNTSRYTTAGSLRLYIASTREICTPWKH